MVSALAEEYTSRTPAGHESTRPGCAGSGAQVRIRLALRARIPALVLGAIAMAAAMPGSAGDLSTGGNIALTSDYIYRGVSESDGRGALQAELHVSDTGGSFGGVWASTRDRDLEPGAGYDLELYLGQRFNLGNAWSASLSARSHYPLGAGRPATDYQEVSAALAWLDRATFSLSYIPNAVRWYDYQRIARGPAVAADASAQWLVGPGLFVTAGGGYYYSSGTGPGMLAATGYLYGSAGLAYELRRWRVEVGYFRAQDHTGDLFPYPPANRVAGTIIWRF